MGPDQADPVQQEVRGRGGGHRSPREELREELPGVLAWAVMGCVEWYQHGLGTAAAVEAATAKYRSETDVMERFLSEVCVVGEGLKVEKQEMYEAYEKWCIEEDEEPRTPKSFTGL